MTVRETVSNWMIFRLKTKKSPKNRLSQSRTRFETSIGSHRQIAKRKPQNVASPCRKANILAFGNLTKNADETYTICWHFWDGVECGDETIKVALGSGVGRLFIFVTSVVVEGVSRVAPSG